MEGRFTPQAKALGVTVLAIIVVGGLSYSNYTTAKQVAKLTAEQKPIVVTKTIEVTPTVMLTATPAASLKTRVTLPSTTRLTK